VLQIRFDGPLAPGGPRPAGVAVRRFGEADGLPPGGMVAQHLGGRTYFRVGDDQPKFLVHDAVEDALVEVETFDRVPRAEFIGGNRIARPGPDGELYVNFGRGTVVMRRQPSGEFELDSRTFGRLADLGGAGAVFMEPDGVAWFANQGRVFRFDTTRGAAAEGDTAPTLIRRVTRGQDTVLFGGGPVGMSPPRLDASSSEMRFEFSVPRFPFGAESATEYRSLLEGLDQEWSAWSREARRDYTNLSFGSYRFRVQGRSPGGRESAEGVYAFVILPPWYRTWWAYALYVALAFLALTAAGSVHRRRVVAKERERAQFTEARLRAEAAEALARSESAGKKQVELLSNIGREITASLEFDAIFGTLYERVNQLADADVFGVGLYHADRHELEYRLAIEDGKRYAPYTRDTRDSNQLPVWCIEHREPVFINDLQAEYGKYLTRIDEQSRPLEDGTQSRQPQSIIYLPLLSKDRVLGVVTIQSFEPHAYTDHHLNVMRSLAAFASVALDNANAYRQLNEQEHEIRRLLEEAEHARAIAEEADAAKSSFLSTVSHELRTPLTSVLGFAKIIKKRLEDRIFPLVPAGDPKVAQTIRQVEENLKVVVSEGERLTKLIDDVLDLAKIEAGKLEWQMEAVAIPDVIERATAATSTLLDQKGLRLVKEVEEGLPLITADCDRLIQVVINLISNAVKFTDAGSVTCRAVRQGSTIVVSVIDTGAGIAPADQPKVFERFKQVGDTLTDKPKGTGLGLPICREIVEHHGGRIWLHSEPGQGSTFSFSLPMALEGPEAGPVDLAALVRQLRDHVVVTTPRRTERESHILVVDDDPNIRELLMQEFVEAGYLVEVAANGREAVAAVRRRRPDLIVLDVMMPEMNGFDVAAVLKNDPDTMEIPIVILSIVQDRERGFRLGVDRYLTKPIDTDLLFREVGALLEQRKSHKRVLVVDEDAPTVRTLTDVLKTRGYSVSEASATDLVEKAKTLQPDIIMLNSATPNPESVQMLRFEKGLENVLFLVYR
jgi:signal transduction histidine kinase/DNA-binding response OmpR family regulator